MTGIENAGTQDAGINKIDIKRIKIKTQKNAEQNQQNLIKGGAAA